VEVFYPASTRGRPTLLYHTLLYLLVSDPIVPYSRYHVTPLQQSTLCIQYLTQLFNAILLRGYFPSQWKVAQFILIPKPGKSPHQLSSYRPISLLPISSKVFEKLLLKRLLPLVEHSNLIPNHQFVFRPRHSTIKQTHRIIRVLNDALDNSQYCSAAFLDISQAFDKVWHKGLLYKLKRSLPLNYVSNSVIRNDLQVPTVK
jgi:hypothetical protein